MSGDYKPEEQPPNQEGVPAQAEGHQPTEAERDDDRTLVMKDDSPSDPTLVMKDDDAADPTLVMDDADAEDPPLVMGDAAEVKDENPDDRTLVMKEEPAQAEPTQEQLTREREALTGQLAQAQQKLDGLDAAVLAVEDEQAALAETQAHFELVERACETLGKLSEEGVSSLFWGEGNGIIASRYLREASERVDGFREELQRLEEKRAKALEAVEAQAQELEFLDYDLYQALAREESRKREWIVEREENALPVRLVAMPWMRGFEDDQRFRKTLAASTLVGLLLGLIIPFIDLPIPERNEVVEVPDRLAQLIRKVPIQPLPEPAPVRPEKPEPELEPEITDEVVPPETAVAEAEPDSTEDKVNSVGILAFRENFSSLSASRPDARLGAEASVSSAGEAAVGLPERAMVTAQGSASSGGINLASISRDISGGGVGLVEGVQLSRVASAIDGGGPDDRPRSAGAVAGRTDEEIQIVFDRYKAALYRLYNRELRKNPALQGQMVLRLTIEPDGSVSLCTLQSSDMKSPSLAERVVDSVSGFQFGAKEVPAITILYPIDFLPTA